MAKGKITLQMLSELMANNTGRSKTSAEVFVRTFFTTLKEALAKDNIIKVKGLGTFKMVVINARESIDVNTGKRVSIAEYNKISFSPDKNLKDKVNRPFSQFETIVIDDEDISIVEDKKVEDQITPISENETTPQIDTAPQSKSNIESNKTEDGMQNVPVDSQTDDSMTVDEKQRHETHTTHEVTLQKKQGKETTSTDSNKIAPHPSSTVVQSDTLPAEEPDDNTGVHKSRNRLLLWIMPAMTILVAAAYVIGYMRIVDTPFLSDIQNRLAVTHTSVVSQPPKETDNVQRKQKRDDTVTNSNDTTNRFPQIADGKYIITGIKTYRRIKPDYDVRRYCMQIYGREDILPYVLLINEIKDESSIKIGKILKFPILVENKITK